MLWHILADVVFLSVLVASSKVAHRRSNPLGQVSDSVGDVETDIITVGAAQSQKYLVASFSSFRQVAYAHLPDNVWRPLVIGNVTSPEAIAVDSANGRLFVADPSTGVVFWYHLDVRPNGMLEVVGERKAAVEGYHAVWLACNGVGDLYFIGRAVEEPAEVTDAAEATSREASQNAIFRQDVVNIAEGVNSRNPVEVYSQSNSGIPTPRVYKPSGLAVDSFNIYWGNKASGTSYGSVCSGPRQNLFALTTAQQGNLKVLDNAFDEVRGITVTGTHVFWLTAEGVHGVQKGSTSTVSDPNQGHIAVAPADTRLAAWDPQSIVFDGDSTLYFTDTANGVVYSVPALNLNMHGITKFVDAPTVSGVAVIEFRKPHSAGAPRAAIAFAVSLCVLISVSAH